MVGDLRAYFIHFGNSPYTFVTLHIQTLWIVRHSCILIPRIHKKDSNTVVLYASVFGFRALLALTLLLLLSISYGISCTSRYYCVTPEVKYISMEQIPNSYLNATAIKTHNVTNVSQCQKVCVREDKCQSINLNVNKIEGYNCHLLSANKYSNSSLLVKDTSFIHLYIPVSIFWAMQFLTALKHRIIGGLE